MAENNGKKFCINREGRPTLILVSTILIIINLVLFLIFGADWYSFTVLGISVLLIVFLLNFFRNPPRHFASEDTEKVVVSPADGTIVAIEEVDETDYFKDRRIVVSIFMSIYSVHANWFPVNGTVLKAEHQDGNFHAAFKPKASTENERSLVVIKTPDESRIDKHLGFIKFGSRVDVYVPLDSLVCVKLDQKVKGDLTILAKLS